jgi:hypothetical protein
LKTTFLNYQNRLYSSSSSSLKDTRLCNRLFFILFCITSLITASRIIALPFGRANWQRPAIAQTKIKEMSAKNLLRGVA